MATVSQLLLIFNNNNNVASDLGYLIDSSNVNVQPYFVPGTGLSHSTCFLANATEHVKSLVATIGIQEDNTCGSISHHIQGSFSSLVPGSISDLVVEHTSNSLRQRCFSVRGRETTKNNDAHMISSFNVLFIL